VRIIFLQEPIKIGLDAGVSVAVAVCGAATGR